MTRRSAIISFFIGYNSFKGSTSLFKEMATCEYLGFNKPNISGKIRSNVNLKDLERTLIKNGEILFERNTNTHYWIRSTPEQCKAMPGIFSKRVKRLNANSSTFDSHFSPPATQSPWKMTSKDLVSKTPISKQVDTVIEFEEDSLENSKRSLEIELGKANTDDDFYNTPGFYDDDVDVGVQIDRNYKRSFDLELRESNAEYVLPTPDSDFNVLYDLNFDDLHTSVKEQAIVSAAVNEKEHSSNSGKKRAPRIPKPVDPKDLLLVQTINEVYEDDFAGPYYIKILRKIPTTFDNGSTLTWSKLSKIGISSTRRNTPKWNELKKVLLELNLLEERPDKIIKRNFE